VTQGSKAWHRAILWAALIIFALWYLGPLYVMVVTSLKDMEQVRGGNLMALPTHIGFGSWSKAWNARAPAPTAAA